MNSVFFLKKLKLILLLKGLADCMTRSENIFWHIRKSLNIKPWETAKTAGNACCVTALSVQCFSDIGEESVTHPFSSNANIVTFWVLNASAYFKWSIS